MTRDDADESAVRRIALQFNRTWNAHAMQRLEEIYAADADFVNVIGIRWKGARQIAQVHVMQKMDQDGWRIAVSQNTDIQGIPNT